ncbi:hypothetical protein AB1N83_010574 [Pleurotus pulmonarius]
MNGIWGGEGGREAGWGEMNRRYVHGRGMETGDRGRSTEGPNCAPRASCIPTRSLLSDLAPCAILEDTSTGVAPAPPRATNTAPRTPRHEELAELASYIKRPHERPGLASCVLRLNGGGIDFGEGLSDFGEQRARTDSIAEAARSGGRRGWDGEGSGLGEMNRRYVQGRKEGGRFIEDAHCELRPEPRASCISTRSLTRASSQTSDLAPAARTLGLVVPIYLSKCRPKACMFATKKSIDGIILWTISTCMIGLIPHIVSLVIFVTMKSTLVWMCVVPITTKVFANCLLSTLNNRLTNLDDHLGPSSIEMAPMFGGSNAPTTVTTSTVRGADQAPVVNPTSSLPIVGSS